MTNELRTNDEPQRILLEASERIKACYPDGTKIEARIEGERVIGTAQYVGVGVWEINDGIFGWPFSPSIHPHRVLP